MPRSEPLTLRETLRRYSAPGTLWRGMADGRIECFACGHRCAIGEGKEGICKVRYNKGGTLFAPWGYVGGVQLDPVEKKPFFHVLPGNRALSFGMLGCDYHCGYCQNWLTSQAIRDPDASPSPQAATPEDLLGIALDYDAALITSTYNEPLITSEWAVEIFKAARHYGLVTSYVSNGNGTPEVLAFLKPWVDAYKVDLKGFNDRQYRKLGGVLDRVLETIRALYEQRFWVEVVTLVVPGFNDSESELRDVARFIASVSPDIPWHVTAFHPDYRMTDSRATSVRSVVRAAEIGEESGLHFVYAGNLPGLVGRFEDTRCPSCSAVVIERSGYRVHSNRLREGGCAACGTILPGIWKRTPTMSAARHRTASL